MKIWNSKVTCQLKDCHQCNLLKLTTHKTSMYHNVMLSHVTSAVWCTENLLFICIQFLVGKTAGHIYSEKFLIILCALCFTSDRKLPHVSRLLDRMMMGIFMEKVLILALLSRRTLGYL